MDDGQAHGGNPGAQGFPMPVLACRGCGTSRQHSLAGGYATQLGPQGFKNTVTPSQCKQEG